MLSGVEIGAFWDLFIDNGYVLDFSTNKFDCFTMESVGVALCEKYRLSKGKSLVAFCNEADSESVLKLLADLLQYYELYMLNRATEEEKYLFDKCKGFIQRECQNISVEVPSIKCVNNAYIVKISSRAFKDIENGDYDSAITKCRTLLEEVFCYAIEKKDGIPSSGGDIHKLYSQVKELYNMHGDGELDKRINMLLSGLEKILSSIAQMRNIASDSHGMGGRRILIEEHHARLFVNSSLLMSDFILSVVKKSKSKVE